jgi:nicotinate-nucleotide adenylyltransferase
VSVNAYFGGSFDPPHLAHDGMLLALLADPWVARVHLVPTGLNPLKDAAATVPTKRRAWIQAWEASLRARAVVGLEKLSLDFSELESAQASYTVNTVRRLQGQHTGDWILALGSDLLPQLKAWREWQALLGSLHSVWVFRRGQAAVNLADPELSAAAEWRLMPQELPHVSSSQVRAALAVTDASRNVSALPLLPEIARLL